MVLHDLLETTYADIRVTTINKEIFVGDPMELVNLDCYKKIENKKVISIMTDTENKIGIVKLLIKE